MLDKIKDTNWAKSELINFGRFFPIHNVDSHSKITCKCTVCNAEISALFSIIQCWIIINITLHSLPRHQWKDFLALRGIFILPKEFLFLIKTSVTSYSWKEMTTESGKVLSYFLLLVCFHSRATQFNFIFCCMMDLDYPDLNLNYELIFLWNDI